MNILINLNNMLLAHQDQQHQLCDVCALHDSMKRNFYFNTSKLYIFFVHFFRKTILYTNIIIRQNSTRYYSIHHAIIYTQLLYENNKYLYKEKRI